MTPSRWTRRRLLTLGLAPAAVLACAAAGGAELVSRGVLPGRALLDGLDGACSVPEPPLAFSPPGAVVAVGPGCHDGSFFTAQEPPSLAFLAGCRAS